MSGEATWFGALGEPLAPADEALIAGILAQHGASRQADIVVVADWPALARVLRELDRDDSWWDFEEDLREQLWMAAGERHTEDDLQQAIAAATDTPRGALAATIAAAMTRASVIDRTLGEAAFAASLLAIHHRTLADLADAPQAHAFYCKHALFAAGRWPLGLQRGSYYVF